MWSVMFLPSWQPSSVTKMPIVNQDSFKDSASKCVNMFCSSFKCGWHKDLKNKIKSGLMHGKSQKWGKEKNTEYAAIVHFLSNNVVD